MIQDIAIIESPEVEKQVLACIMMDIDLFHLHTIKKEYFVEYRTLFVKMKRMIKDDRFDIVLLAEENKDLEVYDVSTSVITISNFVLLLDRLKHLHMSREIELHSRKLNNLSKEIKSKSSYQKEIEHLQDLLVDTQEKDINWQWRIPSLSDDILDDEITSDSVFCGLYQIESTLTFKKWQLVTIGARPSVGKSAVMLNMLMNMYHAGINACFISLEMTEKEMLKRMLSITTQIPYYLIDKKKLSAIQKMELLEAVDSIKQTNINIISDSMDITKLESLIRIQSKRDGKTVFFLDYLQLIKTSWKRDWTSIWEITRTLKQLAINLEVLIIIWSQLSRWIENRIDQRPKLSDLRESWDIEQDSDIVIMLSREKEDVPEDMIIHVVKNRNWSLLEAEIIPFIPQTMTLKND